MDFFNMYLRIKSKIRKIKKINPVYKILPNIRAIIKDNHTVKHVIHEKSFRKNFITNESVKERLIKRYSI
jgi:hypothetical protein